MRNFYPARIKTFGLVILSFLAFLQLGAQSITINGTGVTASATAATPIASTTSARYSRTAWIYPQSLLTAMTSGSGINNLYFQRGGSTTNPLPAGNTLKIYLMNTTAFDWGSSALTWDVSSATLVFDGDISAIAGTSSGLKQFALTAPFTYTGGNLAVLTEYVQPTATSPTTAITWDGNTAAQQTAYTSSNMGKYTHNTSSLQGTLSTTTSTHPVLKLDYTPPPACSGVPVPGTIGKSPTTDVCPGSTVALTVTGTSSGTGINYQLLTSATSNGTYTPSGSAQGIPIFSVAPATTTWYRVRVTCGVNADTTAPINVVVTPVSSGGNYTINSGVVTGGTNFQTFGEAVHTIRCGITAPVKFTVTSGSGPYLEQVVIPQINGASATNTITFKGNLATLKPTMAATGLRAAITLSGADYVTIDSLVIDSSGTGFNWGVHLTGQADFNTISNNIITINQSSTSSSAYAGIVLSGSATSLTSTGNNANNNLITGNSISGGYTGISLYGTSATPNANNIISNNIVKDFYEYGIDLTYQTGAIIRANDISKPTRLNSPTTSGGVILSTGTLNTLVERNRIHNFFDAYTATTGFYGLYTAIDAPAGQENKFYSNLIYNISGNGLQYGIHNAGADSVYYYHNTVVLDNQSSTAGTTYAFYQTTTAQGIKVRNNNFVVSRSGSGDKIALNYAAAASTITSNNNNLVMTGTGGTVNLLAQLGTTDYLTLDDWKATGFDLQSFSVDPLFADPSNGDFRPTVTELNNTGANLGVTTDITGATRSTTPDIGAFEFSMPSCLPGSIFPGFVDASALRVCSGEQFTLDLLNNSVGEGQTYQWQWSTDSLSWTNQGAALVNPFIFNTQSVTRYYRVGVTCGANTVYTPGVKVVTPGLISGNFTINNSIAPSATNFTSFQEAFNYIKCGIDGPVVFNVTGFFYEQVKIPAIPGTSATNTITVNGHGSTLAFAPSVADKRHVILFEGADYVTIDSLNIDATGGTYGWAIHMTNQADHNTIKNSNISADLSGTTANFSGIIINSSYTTATTTGNSANFTTIENNTINGGYYGILAAGTATTFTTDNRILNNIITNTYFYNIYVSNQANLQVRNNDISRAQRSGTTTFYGIYCLAGKSILIEANRIHNSHDVATSQTSTAYGIYVNGPGTSGFETKVINNLVYELNSTAGTTYGIYLNDAYIKAYHNSISLDNTSATAGTTRGFSLGNYIGIELKNNVVSLTRGGTGEKHGIYSSVSAANGLVETNNDIYVPNAGNPTDFFGFSVSNRTTLADWQTTGLGVNTNDKDPGFLSPSTGDLTPSNPYLDNSGTAAGVTTDFFGVARPVNIPDMGAIEFSVPTDVVPPSITFTPLIYTCSTGDRTLTGVAINDITGVHLTGSLAPRIYFKKSGTTAWFSNAGVQTSGTSQNGIWSFTIPSAAMSGVQLGDTISYYIITQDSVGNVSSRPTGVVATNVNTVTTHPANPLKYNVSSLSGTYTIGAGGNYPTLAAAVAAYNNSCLAGPVVFSLIENAYSETGPITINAHAHASATNTLTIKPASGVNATISSTVANNAVIRILGRYVTIDGSNSNAATRNLTISNLSTTTPSVIFIGGTGVTGISNVTLKNTNVINGVNTANALIVRETSNAGGYFTNITIDNNSFQKAYHGVYIMGISAPGNGKDVVVSNNDFTASGTNAIKFVGVLLSNVDSATVSGNKFANFDAASGEVDKAIHLENSTYTKVLNNNISNISYTGTGAFAPYGIYMSQATAKSVIADNLISNLSAAGTVAPAGIYLNGNITGTLITRNNINKIKNTNTTGYGAYGIWLASTSLTSTDTLFNNFISDITGYGSTTATRNGMGVIATSGSGYSVYHNTISLNANQNVAGTPAAFFVSSGVTTAAAINLRNNILLNTQTVGTERYAIYSASSNTVFSNINYNDYYTTGPNLGYVVSNRNNIAAIQAGFGNNANSFSILPKFVSADDLHIDPPYNLALDNKGIALAPYKIDYDQELRSLTTPDVGADEFTSSTGIDIGTIFLMAPNTKSCYSNAETVSVRIRNLSAVTHDFTANPVTVNASVTGTNATTFTPVVINTGTLAPGDSLTVVISSAYDMSATGSYTFNANTVAGDPYPANDTMAAKVINVNAVIAGTISSSRTTYCNAGGKPTLTVTGAANYGSVQWQESTSSSGPWVNAGTGTTYTPASNITSTMYYRMQASCGGNTAMSNTVTVILEQPQITSVTDATRCGPGTLNLQATGSGGTSVLWYTAPTGGSPVYTGTTFTTPVISDTTTYYVSASTAGPTLTAGAPDLSIGASSAVGGYYVNFHVLAPVTIQTVDVFWNGTVGSAYSIIIRDSATQATVSTHNGTTTVTGTTTPQTVQLNSSLSPGVYQIGFATNPGTYRNSTGGSYPYTAPGYLSITGNTFNNNAFYYYYYNWKIGTGCEGSRTPVKANVIPATNITSQPTAQTVCAGSAATFTVATTGAATRTYQWRKNGTPIAGATSASYTIASATAADAANYDVIITGCDADTSVAVALTLKTPAAITTQPLAQTLCAGANTTLSVTATGTGITYQWRKNTTAIAGATSASYTITGAVASDAGSYDVVITGDCNSVTSTAVPVTVNNVPVISTQPVAQAACLGANATFTVTATGVTSYQWRKGGVNIAGATNASFTITGVAAGDAANYDVVITNTCGSVTSALVALSLNSNTVITTQPVNQTICTGAGLSLSVAATGTNLSYQWRKNSTNIAGATSATYAVTAATASDAGTYDVIVSGACTNVTSSTVTVTVNGAPTITTQPVAQTICALNAATFTVAASQTSTGTLSYQWRKGGTPIAGATSASFSIASAAVTDGGSYDVVVTGTCGSVTSNPAVLTVNACTALPSVDADVTTALLMPNVVRQNTVLRVVVRRSMKIDWTISDASGRKVMSFTKQMNAGQTDMTLSLDKLAAGTYYLNANTSRGKIETIRFVKL